MNDEMNSLDTSDAARGCERAADLVTYMYGEASAKEAGLFRHHLNACPVCRAELAAFGDVRQAIGDWRMEALSQLPVLSLDQRLAPATQMHQATYRKRSAVAAIREFFTLSPLWLQAGAVAATLALCTLAALTFARTEIRRDGNGIALRRGVQERIAKDGVDAPVQNSFTQEQINALVDEKVSQRMEVARTEWQKEQEKQVQTLEASLTNNSRKNSSPRLVLASSSQHQSGRKQPASANVSSRNNMYQVAENDSLPRLTDLLGAVNENNK